MKKLFSKFHIDAIVHNMMTYQAHFLLCLYEMPQHVIQSDAIDNEEKRIDRPVLFCEISLDLRNLIFSCYRRGTVADK